MAQPLNISVIRDPDLTPDDYLQIEVDSTVQDDRISIWPSYRHRNVYGFGHPERTTYGFAFSMAYGAGYYGGGYYGQGAPLITLETRQAFVANDYSLRIRAVDALGNAGDWSAVTTFEHRPQPPAPTNLAVTGGLLTWDWSDP